jgi:hypothetical protein
MKSGIGQVHHIRYWISDIFRHMEIAHTSARSIRQWTVETELIDCAVIGS